MVIQVAQLAIAVTAAMANGPVANWPITSSLGGGFKVKMPGPVDEKLNRVESDLAKFDEHVFTCQAGTAFYQLSYVDLPKSLGGDADQLLLSAETGARAIDGEGVHAEGSGISSGNKWRRFRTEVSHGPIVCHYMTVKGMRLYHLEVVAPPGSWRRAKAKDFFDSLSLD